MVSFHQVSPSQPSMDSSSAPTCRMCCPSHPSHCDHQKYSSLSSSLCYYVRSPLFLALRHKYVPKHQISPIKHSPIPQCLTTVTQPLPKRVLHRVRSSTSSFTFKYERNLLCNNTLFVLSNTIFDNNSNFNTSHSL